MCTRFCPGQASRFKLRCAIYDKSMGSADSEFGKKLGVCESKIKGLLQKFDRLLKGDSEGEDLNKALLTELASSRNSTDELLQ